MTKKRMGYMVIIVYSCFFSGCLSFFTLTPSEKLYNAATQGKLNDAQQAVQDGANINFQVREQSLRSPLSQASQLGHYDIVEFLVEKGANINIRAADGTSPLMIAAYAGHFEIVKYLVEKGAELDFKNYNGDTALSNAYERGNMQIYNYLKDQGVTE
ncbi:MAG: ankyrin repeat domain-containing protein [Clostridiales bacterium]|jgi:ankyrin repeat protein|nr:ankyrin repeat domain-containing protein [Clostridiales bacterium]